METNVKNQIYKKENFKVGMLVEIYNSRTKLISNCLVMPIKNSNELCLSGNSESILISDLKDNLSYGDIYIQKIYGFSDDIKDAYTLRTFNRDLLWDRNLILEQMFKKKHLKIGMIVKLRNGSMHLITESFFHEIILMGINSFDYLTSYDNFLKNKITSQLDIMNVYEPSCDGSLYSLLNDRDLKEIYKRQ